MSFTDDFLKELEKKKKKIDNTEVKSPYSGGNKTSQPSSSGDDFTSTFFTELGKAVEREKKRQQLRNDDDIAPVVSDDSAKEEKDPTFTNDSPFATLDGAKGHSISFDREAQDKQKAYYADDSKRNPERTWFKSGALAGGSNAGDVGKSLLFGYDPRKVAKAVLGTTEDAIEELLEGIIEIPERVIDGGAYIVGGAGKLFGADDFANKTKKFIANDLYDSEAFIKENTKHGVANTILGWSGTNSEEASVLGDKSEGLLNSAGQLVGTVALQAVGVPWFVTTGATSFGGEVENAFQQGASYGEAGISAAITAGAEILTEKLSGGIKFGGKALDDGLTTMLARNISNKYVRMGAKFGLDFAGEGAEEWITEDLSRFGQWLTYRDEEELAELLWSEEAMEEKLEAFIGGGVLGGSSSVTNIAKSKSQGVDSVSGLTSNEEAVVKKIYEERVAEAAKNGKVTETAKNRIYDDIVKELEKGGISTDTIEEVLGGETYKSYQNTVAKEDALQAEFDELRKVKTSESTLEQNDRYNELKKQLDDLKTTSERDFLQKKYKSEVYEIAKSDRLIESYNEKARRGQAFAADLSKYDEKQRAVIQKAIDSGILNNTNRSHEFVDLVAKIAADKGVSFDFTNNDKLKNSGFAIDGKTVNGYVTKDGITINIQSEKSLNSVVGHEIAHVLEGTELYTELQNAIVEYAKSKGDYQGRYDALAKIYESVEGADINAELTADLVGDYLFTDADFINNLSTKHRNVFQKIYDEIKYLYKVATAGTKEARELEKVKKAFEKAYQAATKNTITENGVKYALADIKKITPADEQKNSNIQEVAQMSSVYTVDKSKLEASGKGFNEVYGEYFAEWGENIHSETFGDISTKNSSIRSEIRHGSTSEKIAAIEAIPSVIENGKIVDWIEKHPGSYRIIVAAPINIGDTPYIMGVMLQRDSQYQRLYLHDVVIEKETSDLSQDDLITTGSHAENDSLFTTTILQKILNVKKNFQGNEKNTKSVDNKEFSLSDTDGKRLTKEQSEYFKDSKVVDRNGNLLKVYHTTKNDFTVFDDSKKGSTTEGYNTYLGHFFTDNPDYMSEFPDFKGGKTEAYYLNMKNPIDMNNISREAFLDIVEVTGGDVTEAAEVYDTMYAEEVERAKFRNGTPALEISNLLEELTGEYFFDTEFHNALRPNYDKLIAKGYDGVINNMDGAGWANEYVVLNSNQAKLTTNTNPTSDPDIRYSLSELNDEYQTAVKNGNTRDMELAVEKAADLAMPDSKIRDKNGKLIPLYHGTKEMFYEFDTSVNGGKNGVAEGFGIYLSDDTEVTAAYGDRQIKLYANITKPATSYDKTISSGTLAKLIKDTCEKEAKKMVADGEYDSVRDAIKDTWISNYVYTYDMSMDQAYREVANTFLQQNSSDMDIIQEVMFGMAIRDHATASEFYRNSLIPITGFDGFATRWDNETTSNIYLAFDSSQLKSADTITYDDNKNVIPLTERFNLDKKDFRFSLTEKGETPKAYGNYNVYGKDIALEGALSEDIAPVREDVAPVTENAQNLRNSPSENVQEMFPDDFAPMAEEEAAMIENEALDSLTDADAPPEIEMPHYEQRDTGTIDNKSLKGISERASEYLGLNRTERATLEGIIQNYSQNENLTRDDLYSEIKDKFSTLEERVPNEEVVQIKKDLKSMKLYVSDEVKADFGKGVEDGYTKFLRSNFGRLRIVKDITQGVPVDSAYMELSDLYPSYFPDDIINPADQLRKIAEMASMPSEEIFPMELSDAEIEAVADMVYTDISDYMNEERLNAAESIYAPHSDIDAPVIETVAETENKVLSVREMYEQKKNNYKETLAAYEAGKEKSLANFQEAIGKKLNEYNALKNKNTQRANTLLQQIERLRMRRDNVQADYTNRIAKQQARVEAFESKDFSEFENGVLAMRRRDLHKQIVDKAKAQFEAQGYDLDEVLKHAKDLSTFATVDNTPQRVIEKSLGWKEGHILSDITVNKVAQNETEGIKWLNSFTDRKNGLLAQISKQYNIKPGSKESAAAQMYAEGFYVNNDNEVIQYGDAELAKDFPDSKVRENIKALSKDKRIRQIYDETLEAINASRARNAYPEIPKLDNYFLHFRAMEDTFSRLGLPFNPNDIKAKDLPTDLNGVTADLKPGQPYFASAMHRRGQRTSFDLLGGLEKYLTSAKNQIYHIDDIQTLRALRNYVADTYGQAKGLEGLDSLTEEEVQEKIKDVYGSHLSTFAKFLNEEANVIAGKTALIDRGLEGVIGRRAMTFMDTVNRQTGSNMVGYNVSSALTNLIAPVQAFAKTNKADFVKGFAQTVSNRIKSINGKSDGFTEESPVVVRRKGSDRFHRTAWQKLSDPGYALMGAVDNFSTELIARAKYNELTRKGMDSETAHVETDKWVSRLMGDRSLGQQPQLYNSKALGIVTKFQLEVRNQLDSQFYDTIKEANASTEDIQNGLERNAKKAAKIASTFFTLAVGQHIFGKVFESIAGYNPAFDIISVLIKTLGFDDEEDSEDTVLDNIEQGFFELMGDMPYTSILEGGRIPISSALPIEELYKGKDQYGNEKSRWETVLETLPYYLMPGGYGQYKKTTQGLGMFDEDLPVSGSYTDSGKLRFPVEDDLWKRVQAGLFGQYASENARDYFDNERKALDEKQIQEFIDSGISIQDYWEYREGLSGLKTLNEKADYINSLDLPVRVKNLFINNLSGRKEDIDLSGMGGYSDFNEYDFATKNPETYAFLKEHNISVSEYEKFDDDTKEAYTWASKNPEKYTVSKAIASDLVAYRKYTKELYDIKADKDEDGKSISGSRKEKVIDYINNMDADYGQKIILFKTEYPADDTYNNDIIEYLNEREDISYEDMVTILKELGFTVKGNNVYWD